MRPNHLAHIGAARDQHSLRVTTTLWFEKWTEFLGSERPIGAA